MANMETDDPERERKTASLRISIQNLPLKKSASVEISHKNSARNGRSTTVPKLNRKNASVFKMLRTN